MHYGILAITTEQNVSNILVLPKVSVIKLSLVTACTARPRYKSLICMARGE